MKKANKAAKTPYLNVITTKSRAAKQKRIIYRFYVVISTLIILVALIMIAINPASYLSMVVILLLTSIMLISIENMQLRKLAKSKNL